jgi:hypothetical protein
MKKYYWHVFRHKKLFKKQPLPNTFKIEWQKRSLHGEVLSPKTITTEEIILKSQNN